MSDREFGNNDDLSLPKATVAKILTEILPSATPGAAGGGPAGANGSAGAVLASSKDFRDALTECSVEFITLIASEANEISEKEAKKTIAAEHVTAALRELGFPEYVAPVLDTAEEWRKQMALREKKQSKMEQSGLSEEELLRQQQELFASAGAGGS